MLNAVRFHGARRFASSVSSTALESAFARPKLESCLESIKNVKLGAAQPAKPDRDTRHSSVLIPLCTSSQGKPTILFTLRSKRLARHRGYVCFPGGMQHAEDADPVDTALRETEEELGLSRSKIEVIGSFPTFYNPLDKLFMTAVVGMLGEGRDIDVQADLNVNESEVQLAFLRTLEELCEPENLRYTQFRRPHTDYSMPVFLAGQYKIWGLTALILNAFLRTLIPDAYEHEVRCNVLKKKLYLKD